MGAAPLSPTYHCTFGYDDYACRMQVRCELLESRRGDASCCGSDAFYRDGGLLDSEIVVKPERSLGVKGLASEAWEQARLKTTKSKVFLKYALTPSVKENHLARTLSFRRTVSDWKSESDFLGKTLLEWTSEGLPQPREGAYWKKGCGDGLAVRCGPNYVQKRTMTPSNGHLYDCITLDAIRANKPLGEIIGKVVKRIPPPSSGCQWKSGCPLPRVLCINMMLPLYNPKNPWAKECGGCSFVGFFEVSAQTLRQVEEEHPPPAVRLLRRFFEGPAGKPGTPDDPNRSLARRRNPRNKADCDTGLLKSTLLCENMKELGIPEFLQQFNGKSVAITDSGYVVRDPEGEWLELGFDVRRFPFLSVDALYNFRGALPKAQMHCGFSIQAVEDEDLPEGLLCDMHLSGVSLVDDPKEVEPE
eukprot:TRINITY_DN21701_c0_g1_i1.p1 TRINITY_DN21701_c0_g1~~TRINITY_DN21701_c0_g1_i1.p1  ORF type:complete len:416 (-),score=89.84 TRINITY_DN21701_c0_g1_i1:85-1332(-)